MTATHIAVCQDSPFGVRQVNYLRGQKVWSGNAKVVVVLKGAVSVGGLAPLSLMNALIAVGMDQHTEF